MIFKIVPVLSFHPYLRNALHLHDCTVISKTSWKENSSQKSSFSLHPSAVSGSFQGLKHTRQVLQGLFLAQKLGLWLFVLKTFPKRGLFWRSQRGCTSELVVLSPRMSVASRQGDTRTWSLLSWLLLVFCHYCLLCLRNVGTQESWTQGLVCRAGPAGGSEGSNHQWWLDHILSSQGSHQTPGR